VALRVNNMGTKTEELINVLNDIEALLSNDNESNWLKLISSANERIRNSDYSGIELVLSYYGGMGSFNDLIIGQSTINGKFQWKKNSKENNNRLSSLRAKAYELSNYIKHNHETSA